MEHGSTRISFAAAVEKLSGCIPLVSSGASEESNLERYVGQLVGFGNRFVPDLPLHHIDAAG